MNRISNRTLRFRQLSSLFVAAGIAGSTAAGCVVTSDAAQQSNTCSLDSSVGCVAGSSGYSCMGTGAPNLSNAAITCGAGVPGINGATNFCCSTPSAPPATRTRASPRARREVRRATPVPAAPYRTESDPSLTCGDGVLGPNSTTAYCCTTSVANECFSDSSLTSCTGGSTGYSCTGTGLPTDSDASLTCGNGVPGPNSTTAYCCTTSAAGQCFSDSSLTSCTGGSTGHPCTGTSAPSDSRRLPRLRHGGPWDERRDRLLLCCQRGERLLGGHHRHRGLLRRHDGLLLHRHRFAGRRRPLPRLQRGHLGGERLHRLLLLSEHQHVLTGHHRHWVHRRRDGLLLHRHRHPGARRHVNRLQLRNPGGRRYHLLLSAAHLDHQHLHGRLERPGVRGHILRFLLHRNRHPRASERLADVQHPDDGDNGSCFIAARRDTRRGGAVS